MPLPTQTAYVAGSGKTLLLSFLDSSSVPTNLLSYVVSVSQSLMIKGTPGLAGTGRWTATFSGQTTTALEPGCSAATLQAALVALSTIGAGNIAVAGEYPYQATFTGSMAGISQPLFTTTTSGLAVTSIAAPLTAGSGSNVILDSTVGANFAKLGTAWVDGVSGFGPSYKTLATGTGLNQAEWKITGLATGSYNLYISPIGTIGSGVSASTPFRFFDGDIPRGMVTVNQAVLSNIVNIAGGSVAGYQLIGTAYVTSGNLLRVLLTDEVAGGDVGKFIYAASIAAVPIDPAANLIMDGSQTTAYAAPVSGTWGAFGSDWNHSQRYSSTPGDTFAWEFLGLLPGSTYDLEIQWHNSPDRSSNVSYTISDGVNTLGTVTVDQTGPCTGGQTLTDLFSDVWTFKKLGNFVPATPMIKLSLLAVGAGNTIASGALVKLVTAAGYTETVSGTVANLTTGPPTIKVNGGTAIPLTNAIYGIDTLAPWMALLIPGSPLANTDVVTLTTSNNSMLTAAGSIPGVTNQAVANKVGGTVGLPVPDPITMGVGWNLLPPGSYVPIFANMVKNNDGLVQTTPVTNLNADGYPGFNTSSTYGHMDFGQFITNPTNSLGYPLWPLTGTTTVMWDGACGWYPTLIPQQPGTNVAFVALNTGHATNNRLDVNFTVDGSNTTYAPIFSIYFAGLSDIADDADTGRFATTGTWTTQNGGWNGHFHRNNKVITDKATWTLGTLPAGTWSANPYWVSNAGNTTAAVFKVKEAGSQIATYTANQTVAPSGGATKGDYNHNVFTFDGGVAFTSTGGTITIELTGGTDGWAVADAVFVNFGGTLGSPFVPMTNLRVFAPDPGINPASPPEFHPIALATLAGSKSLRSMQLQGAIYGCMADYADYTPASFITYTSGRLRQYTITKIESYSDPNGTFAAMSGDFCSALFTVTSINGAPLPLVNGTAPQFPNNIAVKYTDWTSGNGHVLDLSTTIAIPIEYDPAHMATNQFACGYHAFGPSTLQTLLPSAPCTLTFYLSSIPWPAYFRLCEAVGAKPHINLTRTLTQACVNSIVTDFTTVFPTAQPHYLEVSNEPWNFLFPDFWYFIAVGHANGLVGQMQGYAKVASQRHAWWTTALGSRSGEVSRTFNCQLDGPQTGADVFTYCNAHAQIVDIVMVSAYTGPGLANQTGLTSLYETLTAAQTCDFVDGQIQLANRYQPVFAGWQATVAAQTVTSGHTCRWGIYEGGQASSNIGGSSLTQELQSFAGRYHPLEYGLTLGELALCQSYGCEIRCHYALDQPPNAFQSATYTVMFGVYYAHGAIAGKGDGSDGLHDNRTDIAGAPPGVVNFLTEVTPIGAAYNTWNSASGSVLASGTASVVSVGGTSASLAVGVATGGSSPYTYQWKRSTTSGSGYSNVSGATSTTLTDTGLTSATTYYYVCVVTDAAAATATSNQVSATPLALTSGTASVGSVGATYASVAVDAATGGTGPYTYQWRRSTTSGSGYANVSGATSTILVDTGLTSGTTYYYICVVTDSVAATATSNQVSATPTASSTNPVLNFLILKLFGGAMPAQLGLPVALGRSLRVGVHNDSTFAVPPNVITSKLAGLNNLLAFLAPVTLIAPSDGSGVSAGIGAGQWAFSAISDNSTFNAIGGDVSLIADLSAAPGTGSGTLLFQLQNSADGGTTWPDPGTGITLGSLSVRQGQKTGTTVKV